MPSRSAALDGIAARAPLAVLDPSLARDIRRSISTAKHVAITGRATVHAQYRQAVRESISSFEGRVGDLTDLLTKDLSHVDTARAINFIYSRVISAFQGSLAELLCLGAVSELTAELEHGGRLPGGVRIYVGDVARPVSYKGGTRKGADLHLLAPSHRAGELILAGVVEVKSFACAPDKLRAQIARHISRACDYGLVIKGQRHRVRTLRRPPIRIAVIPASWRLSREFQFLRNGQTRRLETAPLSSIPPCDVDHVGDHEWAITLGWSHEALADAAYAITFWLMGEIGTLAFTQGMPSPWPQMSAAEAGQNAVKEALYHAILRCRTKVAEQRAIALYNTYGFGYSLGANFRADQGRGRRLMLWPKDLEEILVSGATAAGCRIV